MEDEATADLAKQMAFEAAKGKLSPNHEYTMSATDKGDFWEVLILPKGRVRGGGARVHVQKSPAKVLKIVYLQ